MGVVCVPATVRVILGMGWYGDGGGMGMGVVRVPANSAGETNRADRNQLLELKLVSSSFLLLLLHISIMIHIKSNYHTYEV